MSEVDSPASDSWSLIVRLLPPVGQLASSAGWPTGGVHVVGSAVVGTFPGRDITRGTGLLGTNRYCDI